MAIVAATLGLVPASAQQRPPWTTPPSDFGGATPILSRPLLRFSDYPTSAVREGQQGYVVVRFTITARGRAADCVVTRSSGFRRLDAVPCRLILARARFHPARDANGQARATIATTSMQFWMPGGR
jgi:protein TonB